MKLPTTNIDPSSQPQLSHQPPAPILAHPPTNTSSHLRHYPNLNPLPASTASQATHHHPACSQPPPPPPPPPHSHSHSSTPNHDPVFQSLPSSAVVAAAPNPSTQHASLLAMANHHYPMRQPHAPSQTLTPHPLSQQQQHSQPQPPPGHTTPTTVHSPYVRQVTSGVPPPPAPTMPSHRPPPLCQEEVPVAPYRPPVPLPYNGPRLQSTPQMPSAAEGYQRYGAVGGGGGGVGVPRLGARREAPGAMWAGQWLDSEDNMAGNTNAIAMGVRARPRMNQLSESEKRRRHNAHTRSSRLRIDRGLIRLKEILKKARPELKLNKKADVVDAAYHFVQEAMAHLPQAAAPALPHAHAHAPHHAHHDIHETSYSA